MLGSKDIRTIRFSQFYALRLSLLMPYNFLNRFFEVLLDYVLITWNTFQWKAIFFELIRCKNKFKKIYYDSIFVTQKATLTKDINATNQIRQLWWSQHFIALYRLILMIPRFPYFQVLKYNNVDNSIRIWNNQIAIVSKRLLSC